MNVKYNRWNCILQKFKGNRQVKDENVTIFFKNLQNVMLASISYHIIPIDLVIIMLVWKKTYLELR